MTGTYQDYMDAARNADAQGDTDAARQLVQAAIRVRDSQPEPAEPSVWDRASSLYNSTVKPAAEGAYNFAVRDGAGEFAKRANRGILSLLDLPADLAEMAGASPDQTFRVSDLFNNTRLDMTPNPEAWVNKPVVGGQSYGDFVETGSAFSPVFKGVDTGRRVVDQALDFVGAGRAAAPSAATSSALDVARNAPGMDQTKMAEPFNPSASGPGKAPSPVPRVVDDKDAQLLLSRLLPANEMEMIRLASPETRQAMLQMLNQAESINKNPAIFQMPREQIGSLVSGRAEKLSELLKGFGDDISREVKKSAGESVDLTGVQNRLRYGLNELGVKVVKDPETGVESLDFGSSKVQGVGNSEEVITNIFNRINGYGSSSKFDQLHADKQWLSEQASYSRKETGVSGGVDRLVKGLREGINGSLRDISEGYATANDKYTAAVNPFRDIAKLTGDEMANLDDPKVIAELSRKARGLTNNTKQGVDYQYALQGIEDQILANIESMSPEELARLGIDPKSATFRENVKEMAVFASTLDRLYPNMRTTSLQGITENAGRSAAEAALSGAGLREFALNKASQLLRSDASRDAASDARVAQANSDFDRRQRASVNSLFEVLSR